jgi:alkylated DNA repair dioxygenase AlkB
MRLFDEPLMQPQELLPYDGSALYRSGFFNSAECEQMFRSINDETPWEARNIVLFGKEVPQPRLACWYGDLAYSYSGITLDPRPMTPTLLEIKQRCEQAASARFNSVLVNLYRDGQDSMGLHADDEPELGVEPIIASVSFGGERNFRLRHRQSKDLQQISLASGSLLVMSGLSQECWMHDVPKTKKFVAPRINLTFRYIHSG